MKSWKLLILLLYIFIILYADRIFPTSFLGRVRFYSYFLEPWLIPFIYLFIWMYLFIFGHVGSLLLCMGFLYLWCVGATLLFCAAPSLGWPLLLRCTGSRVNAQKLWCMGLVAPWRVESSWQGTGPLSLALAGRFSTTGPLGKSWLIPSKDDRKGLEK